MDRRWAGKGTEQTEWPGLVWVPQLVHREARGRQAVAEVRVGRRMDRVLEWEVQGASQGWWIRSQSKGQEPGGIIRLQVWCEGRMGPVGCRLGGRGRGGIP